MFRAIALFLIPFFVLGPALPHSHAGSGVVAPEGHDLRPHVHLPGLDHHSHDDGHRHHADDDDQSRRDSLESSADHDSDAIYLASSDLSLSRSGGSQRVEQGTMQWVSAVVVYRSGIEAALRADDPPDRCRTLPIYLLTRSMRL